MNETQTSQVQQRNRRISLYDSYGLPWTSHLTLGWMVIVFTATGGLAAIPISLCLGTWIRARTRSALVLGIYLLLSGACVLLFLPESVMNQKRADLVGLCAVALWFAGALVGRYQIGRYYMQREGERFRLSLALTLLFGVWYLNYQIRPEFPTST